MEITKSTKQESYDFSRGRFKNANCNQLKIYGIREEDMATKAGIDYCKCCKSKSLFDTEENGEFITACNDCGTIQQNYKKKKKTNKIITDQYNRGGNKHGRC